MRPLPGLIGSTLASLTLVVLSLGFASTAKADELILNGGFESGFAGWTRVDRAGSSGSFFAATGNVAPVSFNPTVGAASGNFYAISDSQGPGTHSLLQTFVVAPGSGTVVLSFDMFVNNYGGGPFINPAGLDHTASPNQHGRVDILTAAAGAFDTGAGVLQNYYIGADAGSNPRPYIHYVFDITAVVGAGGTFQLRFAEVDNVNILNLGVDNVSIQTRAAAVPEPASMTLLGTGLLGVFGAARRRYRASKN